eukprot:165653-Prymnesium_polylepis.1
MSPLHGRNPWVPASCGGRITRPSPYSEPVGITPTAPRGREYYTRVSHIPPQQYRTVVEKRTARYYTKQFGVSSSIALALTSFTRALRVPLKSFSTEGGAPEFFHCAVGVGRRVRPRAAPGRRPAPVQRHRTRVTI